MPLYDGYEQYRQPLTEAEQEKIRAAEEMEAIQTRDPGLTKVLGGYMDQKGVFAESYTVNAHMAIYLRRAQEQFRGWPVMPENPEVMAAYPGVDPMGKHSVLDVRKAEQEARINATLQTRSKEVAAYVEYLKTGYEAGVLGLKFQEASMKHRLLTRAAKLCDHPETKAYLQAEAIKIELSALATDHKNFMTGLEYASGAKTGPIPPGVLQFFEEKLKKPLDLDMVAKAQERHHLPQEFKVEFENLDHKLTQYQFSDPRNWGKTQAEAEKTPVTQEEVERTVAPYARVTANRLMDPLFQSVEQNPGYAEISRGDLVIIDGQTVREKMFARYVGRGGNPTNFAAYYAANVREETNEFVAAGLMAGKRVETFVPDKYGRIPKEPVQITKTGYEPSPMQKVTLNAWERFWSKHGFYKEKTIQAAEYQRMADARDRVQMTNFHQVQKLYASAFPWTKDVYLSEWQKANPGMEPSGYGKSFSVSRSSVQSIAACALINAGARLEDVFDPTKLMQEKGSMGKIVLDKMRDRDYTWLAEQMFHGQRRIVDTMDQKMQNVNLQDPRQLYQSEMAPLFFAAHTAFDILQEARNVPEEYEAVAERYAPGNGRNMAAEMIGRSRNAGSYFDSAKSALETNLKMSQGMADVQAGCLHEGEICKLVTFQGFQQEHRANSKKPFSRRMDPNASEVLIGSAVMGLVGTADVARLSRELGKRVENQQTFGLDMLAGRGDRLKVTMDMENQTVDFKLQEMPGKAKDAHDLQQTARENMAKAAKPMGGGGGRHM